MKNLAHTYLFIFLLLYGCTTKSKTTEITIQGKTYRFDGNEIERAFLKKASQIEHKDLSAHAEQLAQDIRSGKALKPVPGLKEATEDSSFVFNTERVLEEDILDARGDVLFAKGTKFSPKKGIKVDTGLLLFDGDNPYHVAWAEQQVGEFMWILVKGSPILLQEEKNRPVFFDQLGEITNRFTITKIPCRITQKGESILVESFAVTPKEELQ